ncbi:MAG: DUF5106 domain-containing protein [Bacteroidales bacterium]|nr:DUF5106 domain-containing protein [Bacteroidales bacterium]
MKRIATTLLLILIFVGATSVEAQTTQLKVRPRGLTDSVIYLSQHMRERLLTVDTARRTSGGWYVFDRRTPLPQGCYVLVRQDGKRALRDICLDGERKVTLDGDSLLALNTLKVKGSTSLKAMFTYIATEQQAKVDLRDIERRMADSTLRPSAEAERKELEERMTAFESNARKEGKDQLFFKLMALCETPEVPDSITDKGQFYRHHYWDAFFSANAPKLESQIIATSPDFYNKINYFFFGLLYHADADTIMVEIDRLMSRLQTDTLLSRYVMEHITTPYFRSTRNIGWDAVWCHLVKNYYMAGRCPWQSESNLYTMRQHYNRISRSIIGAHGAELYMADTNQSPNPKDWISSHRFPERYVILWFWDPDCHHCQEQTAQLKELYDSLLTAPDRRFEVYAVGYESDVEKWKRYVRDHQLPFVNVGGMNVNIDYQEAYNVHGAPTMIILDEHRDIIMNKVLPVSSLLKFLDSHEQRLAARQSKIEKKPSF